MQKKDGAQQKPVRMCVDANPQNNTWWWCTPSFGFFFVAEKDVKKMPNKATGTRNTFHECNSQQIPLYTKHWLAG